VHVVAGRGICLEQRDMFAVSYAAVVLDEHFERIHELPLAGLPSRTQLSPSGEFAGVTVFVAGHSYLELGFSTRTSILDARTGRWVVENLESLEVRRNGQTFRRVDFNFWGVTFARDNATFYATLSSRGTMFLVRGRVGEQTLDVVAEGVECPSLSPDNSRIAYKRRVTHALGEVSWQLEVMDLASGARTVLAERRSVDDQVQWLDAERVLYALPRPEHPIIDTWTVAADGSGSPELFLPAAYSTSVVAGPS
jgi:hypothetical protein